ncbi:MAG: tetratricopeptide repeat protein [Planctomycetota bacterium]
MKKKLGEFILEHSWISKEDLTKILSLQQALRKAGSSQESTVLGQLLIKRGILNTQTLQQLLDEQAIFTTPSDSSLETPPQVTKKEIEAEDLLKGLESFSQKTPREGQKENNRTMLSNLAQPQVEAKERKKAFLWKEFEIDEAKRYEIQKILGEGGMGVVELVKDSFLGREVARKTIKLKNLNWEKLSRKEEVLLWRFKQEAKITSLLEHPNIVPLYEMQGNVKGEIQFTMRKVEGQTLRSLFLKMRKGEVEHDESQLLSIFQKVCEAMAYAHSRRVVHRDLKPENVMLGAYGEVYVMDWGIAKLLDDKTEEENSLLEDLLVQEKTEERGDRYKTIGGMGTPGYMPPEQQEDASQVKPQSDIYALGKLLKECFSLLSPIEELRQQAKKAVTLKQTLKSGKTSAEIPIEIEAIVKKATEEQVTNRYEKVLDLSVDVQHYLKNQLVSAKTYNPLEILLKWSKRNWKFLSAVSLFILLGIGLWSYWKWQEAQEILQNYKEAYREAKEKRTLAEKDTKSGREGRAKKTELFLGALFSLNKALAQKTNDLEAEQEKLEVGEQLLQICYEGEEFELASYVAKELGNLSQLKKENPRNYLTEVKDKKKERLEKHQKKLNEWITKAKPNREDPNWKGLEEGEPKDFIAEVSQMFEPEIYEQLCQELEAGRQFFLDKLEGKNFLHQSKTEEYSLFIIEILGRLGKTESANLLWETLDEVAKKLLTKYPKNNLPEPELNYMVALAEALGNLKAVSFSLRVEILRNEMGVTSLFGSRTQLASKKIIEGYLQYLDSQIQFNPQSDATFNSRGIAKFYKGDLSGAIVDYNETIRLNPQNSEAYNGRGSAKYVKRDYDGAIVDYTEAIRLNPQNDRAYTNRGLAKNDKGDYNGAIVDYTEAIHINPQNSEVYYNRGVTKYAKEDPDGAIADYTEAIRLNPQNDRVYNGRGLLKYAKRNYDGAIVDYTEAIHLNPQNATTYNNRGVAKNAKRDSDGAIVDYNEAIRLDPQNPEAYANRGLAKYAKKDYDGTIADYTEAIRLNPQFANIYNERGLAKYTKGDYDGAIADYTELIRLNPQNSEAYSNRGLAKYAKGDYDGAIADHNEAIRLNPQNANFYTNRGFAKKNKGDYDGAIADYNESVRINPQFDKAYNNRGLAKNAKGDYDGAIADHNEAIRLNPQNTFAPKNKELALKKLLERYDERLKQEKYELAKEDLLILKKYMSDPSNRLEEELNKLEKLLHEKSPKKQE